jgi:VanZ family protein
VTGCQAVVAARRWIGTWPRWARWLAVLGWMGLIFGVSAQPDLPHPSSGMLDWLVSIAGHVSEYAMLGGLLAWAIRRGRTWKGLGLAFFYALSDELHQAFVPGRTADPLDLVFDVLGAAVGIGLFVWLSVRLRR